jgi:hypothetical protein
MTLGEMQRFLNTPKAPLNGIYRPMSAGLARVMYRFAASQHWLVGAQAFMDAAMPSQSARDAYRVAADHNLLPVLGRYSDLSFHVRVDHQSGRTITPKLAIASGFGMPLLGLAYTSRRSGDPIGAIYPEADVSGQITDVSNRLASLADDLDSAITVIEWLHSNAGKLSHAATYFPSLIQLVQFGAKYSPATQQAWKLLKLQKPLTDDHPFVPSKVRQAMDHLAGLIAVTSVLGDNAEQELYDNHYAQMKKTTVEPCVMFLTCRRPSSDTWSLTLSDFATSLGQNER